MTYLITLFHDLVSLAADFFLQMGYPGITIMMLIEASFIPFPSEVVMIPAGIAAAKGEMNIIIAVVCGTVGSVLGATVNYCLGRYLGRDFLHANCKYFFLDKEKLDKMDKLFLHKGATIAFVGRLIPVVRQYISIPAGISKMNYWQFVGYTALGSVIWTGILAIVGFKYGENKDQIDKVLFEYKEIIIVVVVLIIAYYGYKIFKKKK